MGGQELKTHKLERQFEVPKIQQCNRTKKTQSEALLIEMCAYLSELFNILFALFAVRVRIGFVLLLKLGSAVSALDHRECTTTVLAVGVG